jgi:hypothetical protein
MENLSHLLVAMIIVIIGIAAVVWAFSFFGTGCAAGVPCHAEETPHAVTYQ